MRSRAGTRVAIYVLLVVVSVTAVFPIYWLFSSALKPAKDLWTIPPSFFPLQPDFSHLAQIIREREFPKYLFNSLVVSLGSAAISLFLGSLVAYSLTRYPMRGRKQIAFWLISLRMMPPIVVILPLYIFFTRLGLIDSHLGLVLAHVTFNLPFASWMLAGFFREIPKEIDEAALLDGCTSVGALFRVVLPLAAGGIAATGVFCVLWSWNDFIFSFSLTSTKAATLPVPISGFLGDYVWEWSAFYAGGSIAAIPIVLLAIFAQRYLVRGMTLGAVSS
jgi:multiple sugar transport system permease protein